jgi:hypothetical protein
MATEPACELDTLLLLHSQAQAHMLVLRTLPEQELLQGIASALSAYMIACGGGPSTVDAASMASAALSAPAASAGQTATGSANSFSAASSDTLAAPMQFACSAAGPDTTSIAPSLSSPAPHSPATPSADDSAESSCLPVFAAPAASAVSGPEAIFWQEMYSGGCRVYFRIPLRRTCFNF